MSLDRETVANLAGKHEVRQNYEYDTSEAARQQLLRPDDAIFMMCQISYKTNYTRIFGQACT